MPTPTAFRWHQRLIWLATDPPENRLVPCYAGLAVHRTVERGPRAKRFPWVITHIGSGHVVVRMPRYTDARALVRALAPLGDWTWTGPEGWKNQWPNFREDVSTFLKEHPLTAGRQRAIVKGDPFTNHTEAHLERARKVAQLLSQGA